MLQEKCRTILKMTKVFLDFYFLLLAHFLRHYKKKIQTIKLRSQEKPDQHIPIALKKKLPDKNTFENAYLDLMTTKKGCHATGWQRNKSLDKT